MRPLRPARLALTLFLVAAFSAVALVAQAAPGNLDTTFSGDGMRTLSFGPGADSGRDILALAGGKLLVAGQAQVGGTTRFGLARLRANGALDTTFGGGDGRVVGPAGAAWGLVVNSAGAIVVAGQADPGLVAVARYTAAGAVDTTFGGGDGLALTGFGAGTTSIAYDVILVGGGKILVTGEVWNGVDYDLILARYLASGALDTTFGGGDGKVVVDFAGGDDGGFDLLLLPNGKVLVTGWVGVGAEIDPAVLRFTAAGALDTTFGGGDGVARVNFAAGVGGGSALVRLSDGRLVLAGHARVGGDYDIVLARLTPAGVLDPTFGGGDGKAVLNLAGDDFTGDMALIGGKLYVSGSVGDNLAVVRFAGNGSVDPTFGVGGVAAADFGVVSEGDNGGMAVQSDGKLVVVGRAFGAETSWAVARFLRS